MKIAVAYDNGQVFQHFGKTESFKIYDVENGKIMSAQVIGTDGNGHEALAAFLADKGVSVVICGGLGEGAQEALTDEGIEIYSGAKGAADDAAEAFICGELESHGVNCDHHHDHHEHHHEHECGCGHDHGHQEPCEGEHGCSGHCGDCGGCHHEPEFEGPNVGKICRTHYRGTFNDGTEFDSSYGRGEPLEFICGAGMMIRGFDEAVATMEVGQKLDIHLTPDQAYGYPDPSAVFTVEIKELPGAEDLSVGERVMLYNNMGNPIPVTVTARDDATITFDANHELAGKELNFTIELVEVR